MNESKKYKVVCAECGKVEYVTESRYKRYKTCSLTCMGKYNSKRYSKKVELTCPICGIQYTCKQSKISHHRTCGKKECRSKWLSITRTGELNQNYRRIEEELSKTSVSVKQHDTSRNLYLHVVKEVLKLPSISKIPKGYVVHHKDANHMNNTPSNLVLLPKSTHRLIHTKFGNILIRSLHTGFISKETFFSMCNEEEKQFYKEIIDLNITHQAVIKQGELLESLEEGNQQPSIYRNIYEGSTTNERDLTCNDEVGNFDTSALPVPQEQW